MTNLKMCLFLIMTKTDLGYLLIFREGEVGRSVVVVGVVVVVWEQRQKNPVGVSALPTGKFLRVWKVFARIYTIDHKIK